MGAEESRAPDPPRIEREDGDVQTDEYGNALGGLRLPPIDVPVAHYDARSCDLLGRTFRFDEETLGELYPTRDEYVARMRAATEDALAAGILLEPGAADLMGRVENAPIGAE